MYTVPSSPHPPPLQIEVTGTTLPDGPPTVKEVGVHLTLTFVHFGDKPPPPGGQPNRKQPGMMLKLGAAGGLGGGYVCHTG